MDKIPLSQPDIAAPERKAVAEVLKTSHLSLGKKLGEFEALLAKAAGVKYAVAVNSGTSALHLIVRALGIGAGDEVITTPFSFVASSNCLLYEGAKPVFVDIDLETFNIDPAKIEAKITKRTKAILAVDVFGRPADWDALKKIAKKHKLLLIEDSAEALGSLYKGRPCGSFGEAAVFAFYPNKQITTGEGGAVLTNRKDIANACRSMSNQGRPFIGGRWLRHERLGYNYRLDEMSCALGIAQLGRFKEIARKRAVAAARYEKSLSGIDGIRLPVAQKHEAVNWFVYVVLLDKKYAGPVRERIMQKMAAEGISSSDYFMPIHLQPFYRQELGYGPGRFSVAEDAGSRTLALPFYGNLMDGQIRRVSQALKNALQNA